MEESKLAIYDRLLDETSRAFHAFCIYRDGGPRRTLKAVDEALRPGRPQRGHKETTVSGVVKRWSAKYCWVDRARAYDNHLDQQRRLVREEEIRDREKAHLDAGKKAVEKALRCLDVFQPATVTLREEADEHGSVQLVRVIKSRVTAQGIATLMRVGVEIERLALGLATGREHDRDEYVEQFAGHLQRLAGKHETPSPRPRSGSADPGADGSPDVDGVDARAPTD